jgi:hypothetical protein
MGARITTKGGGRPGDLELGAAGDGGDHAADDHSVEPVVRRDPDRDGQRHR